MFYDLISLNIQYLITQNDPFEVKNMISTEKWFKKTF